MKSRLSPPLARRAVRCMAVCCAAACLPALAGCVGTTGGEIVTFDAFAAGPEDAVAGQPYTFETGRGYAVTLTKAELFVGAVYLNQSRPASVGSNTSCFLTGIYVAEVTEGLRVDVLSPELQPFPEPGSGTTGRALAAEVWLFGGRDINEPTDPTVILDVAGTAEKDGETYPFEGEITISDNRVVPPSSPALPGAAPICKERVVTPIPADVELSPGDDLVLRIDPRGLFRNVEFRDLEQVPGSPPLYLFRDDSQDAPSDNLYRGLRAAQGTYSVHVGAIP